jgi:hypothetical protein
MERGDHGLPKVSPRPALPNPSTPNATHLYLFNSPRQFVAVVVVFVIIVLVVVIVVVIVVVVVVVAGRISRFNYGHLASLRLTTTEAETHNERLCAHTLGDHTGHVYPVCVLMCACVACVYLSEEDLPLPLSP